MAGSLLSTDVAEDLSGMSRPSGPADVYFSADVETDGSIPGVYSMLSFAFVYAGRFDGEDFIRPPNLEQSFYRELKPISNDYEPEALKVNQLDRDRLCQFGDEPGEAMTEAAKWVLSVAASASPILVAYPLSFDWAWLYWYFMKFSKIGSPFNHSLCFDVKTAFAVKAKLPISQSGRSRLTSVLKSTRRHSHHALDDAIEQAEVFANIFEWQGKGGG